MTDMITDVSCPTCRLTLEVEQLRAEAKAARLTSGVRCWVKDEGGEMVVTIARAISSDQRTRLFDLLAEIEKS